MKELVKSTAISIEEKIWLNPFTPERYLPVTGTELYNTIGFGDEETVRIQLVPFRRRGFLRI